MHISRAHWSKQTDEKTSPDFDLCISCKYIPRRIDKAKFVESVGEEIAKTLPGYIYEDETMLAIVAEFIIYLTNFHLKPVTISSYALQLIFLKSFIDSEYSPNVFKRCGLGFIASRSLIRSYSIRAAPSSARNITYALKFAGQLLQEKNPFYKSHEYISLFKEIRSSASRRLHSREITRSIEEDDIQKIYAKIKRNLEQALALDIIQDSNLLKFQQYLFGAMVVLTTQRANAFSKLKIADIKSIDGRMALFLETGRKRNHRDGLCRYILGDNWVYLEKSIKLWISSLRKRFYELNCSPRSSSTLADLPFFFSSHLKPLSQMTAGSWMDKICGRHITITDFRKGITEVAFSSDFLTEDQSWDMALRGDHTKATIQHHYVKNRYAKSQSSDLLDDMLSGELKRKRLKEREHERRSQDVEMSKPTKRRHADEDERTAFERIFLDEEEKSDGERRRKKDFDSSGIVTVSEEESDSYDIFQGIE
ncbi:hypothetical protein ADUPG1_009835 [Aduncisulcus paluster]|uniref:Uncharacterized protein n=1 Tax=Aduncisulcus paluster TaxID=2918883 RepID=A0ABQ5KWZ7_9EUKA|nr:hypothetical protein ADUPG1_009835 [Aduncisulcus paluster]